MRHMSEQHKLLLLKLLNIAVWLVLAIALVTTVLYHYPRKTVEFSNFVTEKDSYRVGEILVTSADTEIFFTGKSNYDIRLECDKGRYLLASFDTISYESDKSKSARPIGAIPVIPTPDHCTVRVQASHTVEIGPMLSRTYTQELESNRFKVEAGR